MTQYGLFQTRSNAKRSFQKVGALLAMTSLAAALASAPAHALTININPGGALAANSAALGAFNRAASQWAARISDPITVTINANLASLSPGVLGQASSVILNAGYDTLRNAMVADSAGETDDGVVSALPTSGQFSALLPTGFGFNGQLSATKANLKALGFTGLDSQFGTADADITFSTNFSFDFDVSDGVGAGLIDFETVAAHEIGHALGFRSVVDTIDVLIAQNQVGNIAPSTLDLFRFPAGGDPNTLAEFTANARSLVPGNGAVFDDLAHELAFSTGAFNGDGRQASHWKDNNLTGTLMGIMDPTLASGTFVPVGDNDLRALDLIGYDIAAVPVPAALYLFVSGLTGMVMFGRAQRAARQGRA